MSGRSTVRSPIPASTRELVVACAAVLVVFFVGVGLKASGSSWAGGDAWIARGDFEEFYIVGRILNDHDEARLYDFARQSQVYRDVVPGATTLKLPFAHPPLVAVAFRPLARLPFSTALRVFLAITPIVFLAALWLLTGTFGPFPRDERALALLAGMSFFPFLGYTWLGGQISVIGLAAIALALAEEDRGRPFRSGLALSLCLYKPTLLVLILPMLVLTRPVRQLAGFIAGASVVGLASLLLAGREANLAFIEKTKWMIDQSMAAGDPPFNEFRYIDVNAFFRLLPYGRSAGGYLLLAGISMIAATALVRVWLQSRTIDRHKSLLVWAATLAWTPILSIYTPFYDSILVVPAGVLSVAAVRARAWQGWNRLGPMLACVYVTPWLAEICARTFNVQIYTLVLGAFGTLLLVEANRPVAATTIREQRRHEGGAI